MSAPTGRVAPTCPVVHLDHWDRSSTAPTARAQYADLLAAPGVAWSDRHGGFWILSHYDDVKAALSDDARFSSAAAGVFLPSQVHRGIALEQDQPDHTPMRRLYAEWLNPRLLRTFHPVIEELTRHHVRRFADAGGGDFVHEVSARLPVQIIARTLGIDADDAAELHDAAELTAAATSTEEGDATFRAFLELCSAQIEQRRTAPREDFLSHAVAAQVDGRPITDDELLGWVSGAVFAGHDTTLMVGAALIGDLARDPALQDRVRRDTALVPRMVEESLRLHSPVQRFFRTVTEDVELHGNTLRAGDRVMIVYAAANIDAERFPDPLALDLDREFTRHLGFGWGRHRCVGAPLALHELRVLAEVMLRTGRWELAGEPVYGGPTVRGSFLGLASLPLTMSASG